MKIHITSGFFHHMNKKSLDNIISHLKWEKVKSIEEADIVYSPSTYVNTENYINKKFIFGPHFSVFPNEAARKISSKHNNSVYIQPSEPSVNTWVNEFSFNNIPVKAFPFPLKIEDYSVSTEEKDLVLIYFKDRNPEDLKKVKEFVESKNLKYEIIFYGKYKEEEYQRKLNKVKYVIWLGSHESQGFALESVMCKNIPLLVWSVTLRNQVHNCPAQYHTVKSEVSTVPYWDERCGEKFYTYNKLESSHNTLISKLDSYSPRKFANEVLSVEKCSDNLLELISSIGK